MRQLRLSKGLSQLDLAESAELSEDQINKIERGKSWVRKQTLGRLAAALDVTEHSLLDYSGNEEFLACGGFRQRAPRRSPKLIVRKKRI